MATSSPTCASRGWCPPPARATDAARKSTSETPSSRTRTAFSLWHTRVSPEPCNAIAVQHDVHADDGCIFHTCLADENAIERVPMVERKRNQPVQVFRADRQELNAVRAQLPRDELVKRGR